MKGNTLLRQESIKKVLFEIRANGPISKRELQAIMGFSWGNISSIITNLLDKKFIVSSGKQDTASGRKPEEYDINVNDNYIIGIDFNSEGILAILGDLKGRIVSKYEVEFREKTREKAEELLFSIIDRIITENKNKNIFYIALAMQGAVDIKNGISVKIGAIDGWCNVPVCEMLEKKFNKKTVMLHDPDCLLYAERFFGKLSGEDGENALLLRMDHGIGIAAMLENRMYMGSKGRTCEIGEMLIPIGENTERFMVRELISEKMLARQYKEITKTKEDVTADIIAEKARTGDKTALMLFARIGEALAIALNNTANLLNPETVVIFGAFRRYADLFLEDTKGILNQLMGEKAPAIKLSDLEISAAAIGAVLFAADMFIDDTVFVEL